MGIRHKEEVRDVLRVKELILSRGERVDQMFCSIYVTFSG
jgi:hypothetical protein